MHCIVHNGGGYVATVNPTVYVDGGYSHCRGYIWLQIVTLYMTTVTTVNSACFMTNRYYNRVS